MSFLFITLQHYELSDSLLIVYMQKSVFQGQDCSQEGPCVLANFVLVWDFPESWRCTKNIVQNLSYVRAWKFRLPMTCSVAVPPASTWDFTVSTTVLCFVLQLIWSKTSLNSMEIQPVLPYIWAAWRLGNCYYPYICAPSEHPSFSPTTASLHKTFSLVGVNGLAAPTEAWR